MPKKLINKVRSLMKPKAVGEGVESETPAPEKPAPRKAAPKKTSAPKADSAASPAVDAETKTVAPPPVDAHSAKEAEAKPAAKRPARKRKPAGDDSHEGHMPEPLRQAKKVRSREAAAEEWRPSKARTPTPKADAGQSEAPEKPKPRAAKSRASKPRDTKPGADKAGEKRSPRKPAASSKENGKNEGRRDKAPRESKEGNKGERQSGTQAGDPAENRNRGRGRRAPRSRSSESGRGEPSRERENTPSRGKGFSFPRPKSEHGDWTPAQYVVAEKEGKTRFTDLNLPSELLHAVSDLGYEYCTPIQAEILPTLLDGRDGLGQAQTGTGKTAAFLLASFTRMLRNPRQDPPKGAPRILIVAPTRELVLQIEEEAAEIGKYTPFQTLPVYGGLDFEAQKDALMDNVVDLVAATPGRLLDFLRKKVINLSHVETLVLDEADRMLDMGFIPDVKRIVYATPHKDKRQTLFFSATFTDDVRKLAESWTRDAVSVVIEPENVAADTVDQTVFIVTDEQKFPLTVNLLRNLKPSRCLIFANRRDSAQYLCDRLKDYEFSSALLTGAVPQAKRVRTLEDFKSGKIPIVVATDVAGRGIHVEEVELVINFNLPEDAEDYVHRIGRTGRAGAEGRSVGFADEMDAMLVPDIEKFLGRELKCTHPEDAWLEVEPRERTHHKQRRERDRDSGGGGRGGGGRGRGAPRGGSARGGARGGPRGGTRGGRGR